jgi:hypothetical protein
MWLRLGSSGGFLWTWFHKRLAEQLLAANGDPSPWNGLILNVIRFRYEDNIKTDLKGMECEYDCIF